MKKLIIGCVVWLFIMVAVMVLFDNPYINAIVILVCIAHLMLLAPKEKKKKNHIDYDND